MLCPLTGRGSGSRPTTLYDLNWRTRLSICALKRTGRLRALKLRVPAIASIWSTLRSEAANKRRGTSHRVPDAAASLELGFAVAGQVRLLIAPRVMHHLPAVAREVGTVDDQRAERPLAGRFLELVGPAPVIGQGLRVEEFWILRRRFVDEYQNDLALDVDAFVVVPAVLRRLDAVADEEEI